MAVQVRKSIQLMPGVRMNISKSGVGYSVGGKGYRVTHAANGRITRTISIPGTGIRDVTTIRPATRRTRPAAQPSARVTAAATQPRPVAPPRPGLFAAAWEKHLFRAVHTPTETGLAEVARHYGHKHPDARVLAAALDGLRAYGIIDPAHQARSRELIGWSIRQGVDIKNHQFVKNYLADTTWPVEIACGVTAHLTIPQDVLLLAAGELHLAAGDVNAAIWTVAQAALTTMSALSLAELYGDAGRHHDVIDLTDGLAVSDDATTLLIILRGRAFSELGYHDAAREVLASALNNYWAAPRVLHRGLIETAHVDFAQNRHADGHRILRTVLAEDPHYPGIREWLAAHAAPRL